MKNKKPLTEVDKYLPAYRDYHDKCYTAADFIAAGTRSPRIGGELMIASTDCDAVSSIISHAPF